MYRSIPGHLLPSSQNGVGPVGLLYCKYITITTPKYALTLLQDSPRCPALASGPLDAAVWGDGRKPAPLQRRGWSSESYVGEIPSLFRLAEPMTDERSCCRKVLGHVSLPAASASLGEAALAVLGEAPEVAPSGETGFVAGGSFRLQPQTVVQSVLCGSGTQDKLGAYCATAPSTSPHHVSACLVSLAVQPWLPAQMLQCLAKGQIRHPRRGGSRRV